MALYTAANAYREECSGKSLCGFCAYDPPAGMEYPCECPGFYKNECFRWQFADDIEKLVPIKEEEKMSDKIELKPCPFCGGKAKMVVYTNYNDYNDYVVNCTKCGASVPIWHETEKEAAQWWNRRDENG